MFKKYLILGDSVAISTITSARPGKFLGAAAVAAALCVSPMAKAGMLDFETPLESPFVFTGERISLGNYWLEAYGGIEEGDWVGSVVDTDSCFMIACAENNPTRFYTAVADSYFYFGKNDNSTFRLKSLQASFLGFDGESYPGVASVLVLQGFNADGTAAAPATQLALSGPVTGAFNFATYDMGSFGQVEYSFVRVLGFACDNNGDCNRNTNQSNFAVDNITFVPEPASMGLFGLGLLGLATIRRRSAR